MFTLLLLVSPDVWCIFPWLLAPQIDKLCMYFFPGWPNPHRLVFMVYVHDWHIEMFFRASSIRLYIKDDAWLYIWYTVGDLSWSISPHQKTNWIHPGASRRFFLNHPRYTWYQVISPVFRCCQSNIGCEEIPRSSGSYTWYMFTQIYKSNGPCVNSSFVYLSVDSSVDHVLWICMLLQLLVASLHLKYAYVTYGSRKGTKILHHFFSVPEGDRTSTTPRPAARYGLKNGLPNFVVLAGYAGDWRPDLFCVLWEKSTEKHPSITTNSTNHLGAPPWTHGHPPRDFSPIKNWMWPIQTARWYHQTKKGITTLPTKAPWVC